MITKIKTLTNLNNFYRFINSDPLSFNGIYLSCVNDSNTLCGEDEIWDSHQFPLSREKLAEITQRVEAEVSNILGTHVKPKWVREEIDVPANWFNNKTHKRIEDIIFRTHNTFIKRAGQQRLERVVESVEITYSDSDGDGFNEQAVINFTLPENENLCDVKLFFQDSQNEITGFNIVSFDTNTREVRITIDAWLLIKPELYINRTFIKNSPAIDGCDSNNFVEFIDIWINGIDPCKPSIELVIDESHTCNGSCTDSIQPACMKIQNKCEGTFTIIPQAYDEEDGCVTNKTNTLCGRIVKIIAYYEVGCFSTNCDGLCNDDCFCSDLEDIIFKIVAARYPYPTCDCKCIQSVLKTYSQQTSLIVKSEGRTFRYNDRYMDNAILGTTVGEIEAAIALLNIREKFCSYE